MTIKFRPLPNHIPKEQLQKGDILLFRTPSTPTQDMKLIMFVQSLFRKKFGHKQTTHSAIVVDFNENGEPLIAHSTEKGKEGDPDYKLGYVKEPLQALLDRDNDRSFIIYRPINTKLGEEIAKVANNAEKIGIIWTYGSGKDALFTRSTRHPDREVSPDDKPLSTSSICSQFTIEVLKKAAKSFARKIKNPTGFFKASEIEGYPHISSSSTPKTLEDHLFQQEDYAQFCYLGQQPANKLCNVISQQLEILLEVEEYAVINNEIWKIKDQDLNETEKCVRILNKTLPILNRGKLFFHSIEYKTVMKEARALGIFEEEIKASAALGS